MMIYGSKQETTNNQMELQAVVSAMQKVLSDCNLVQKKKYEFYSDSAYVVNSINMKYVNKWSRMNWRKKEGDIVKNNDLWKKYLKLYDDFGKNGISVKFIKVKGHSGEPFNELADAVSKLRVKLLKEQLENDDEQS